MSFLTIAIIIAIVLVILTYMDHLIFDFPESLGMLAFIGLPVDLITIAICIGIRTGWIGFIISAIISFFLFFGIDKHTSLLQEKRWEKDKKEMEAEKNKLLEYMKLHYPQYKFNGDTAKIFYNNYQLHAIGQESTIWSRVLEGEICVKSGSRIEIRFYHPYGDWYDSKGAIQVFLNNCNTPNRKPKLELRDKICAVNDIFVSGFSINSCALEDCIYNTAKYLEAVDKELVKEIYNH